MDMDTTTAQRPRHTAVVAVLTVTVFQGRLVVVLSPVVVAVLTVTVLLIVHTLRSGLVVVLSPVVVAVLTVTVLLIVHTLRSGLVVALLTMRALVEVVYAVAQVGFGVVMFIFPLGCRAEGPKFKNVLAAVVTARVQMTEQLVSLVQVFLGNHAGEYEAHRMQARPLTTCSTRSTIARLPCSQVCWAILLT
jgi:hypothetical protein